MTCAVLTVCGLTVCGLTVCGLMVWLLRMRCLPEGSCSCAGG
jgi:hypothetical protein